MTGETAPTHQSPERALGLDLTRVTEAAAQGQQPHRSRGPRSYRRHVLTTARRPGRWSVRRDHDARTVSARDREEEQWQTS